MPNFQLDIDLIVHFNISPHNMHGQHNPCMMYLMLYWWRPQVTQRIDIIPGDKYTKKVVFDFGNNKYGIGYVIEWFMHYIWVMLSE